MSGSSPVVELYDVSKRYGQREVVTGINLTVQAGEAVGLIGANGSGKTTVLRMVAGLVQPSQGTVLVHGQALATASGGAFPEVGVLFDPPGFLPHLSGFTNLSMLASLRAIIDNAEVRHWIERLGLNPHDRKPVGTYSQGMLQRLGLAQALMECPSILLLDEPTNALDPAGVHLVDNLIREAQGRGVAILIASHYLEGVARECTRVFKLVEGRMTPAISTDFNRPTQTDTERNVP